MTWIRKRAPHEIADALKDGTAGYPEEYGPSRREQRPLPPDVKNESIVMAHSLMPEALRHMFKAYGAMLDDALPLSRRHHELIATVVSAINDCYY